MNTKRISKLFALLLSLVMVLELLPANMRPFTAVAASLPYDTIELTVDKPVDGKMPDFSVLTTLGLQAYDCIWYEGTNVNGIPADDICLKDGYNVKIDAASSSIYTMRVFISALSPYTLPSTPITVTVNGVVAPLVKLPAQLGYTGTYKDTYVVEYSFAVTPSGAYNTPTDLTGIYASGWTTVSGDDEECFYKLKELLESPDTIAIRMEDGIDDYEISASELFTVNGKKYLDLNGYRVQVYMDQSDVNAMITIPSGAEMMLLDNSEDGDGSLNLNHSIGDDGCNANQSIFTVSGKLTVQGGVIDPGRSKKQWLDLARKDGESNGVKYSGYVRNQVSGNGVIVEEGGELTVNGGSVFGRGFSYLTQYGYGRCAAILGKAGSTITLNDGYFKGNGCANVLQIEDTCNFTLRSGEFDTHKVDKVRLDNRKSISGAWSDENYADGTYGEIGIPAGAVNAYTTNVIVGGDVQEVDENGNLSADATSKKTFVEPKERSSTQYGECGVQLIKGITSSGKESTQTNDELSYQSVTGYWTLGSSGLIKTIYTDSERIFPANALNQDFNLNTISMDYYKWTLYQGDYVAGTTTKTGNTLDINGGFYDENGNTVLLKSGFNYEIVASVIEKWNGTNEYEIERVIGSVKILVTDVDYSSIANAELIRTWQGDTRSYPNGEFADCEVELNNPVRVALDEMLSSGFITNWYVNVEYTEYREGSVSAQKYVFDTNTLGARTIQGARVGLLPVTASVFVKYKSGVTTKIHSQRVDVMIMPALKAESGVTYTDDSQTVVLNDPLNINSYAKLNAGLDVMAEIATNVYSGGEKQGQSFDLDNIYWEYCPDISFFTTNTEVINSTFDGAVRGGDRGETDNVLYARKPGVYRAYTVIDGNEYYSASEIILTSDAVYTKLPARLESSAYRTEFGSENRLSVNLTPEQGMTSEWGDNIRVIFQCVSAPEGASVSPSIDLNNGTQYISGSGADTTCLIDGFFRNDISNVVPGEYAFRAIVEDVDTRVYLSGVIGEGSYVSTQVRTNEVFVTYDYVAENVEIYADGENTTNQTGSGSYIVPAQTNKLLLNAIMSPDKATRIDGDASAEFYWSVIRGSDVGTIDRGVGSYTTFNALTPGTCTVEVRVKSGDTTVLRATCDITVPIAGFTIEKPTPVIGQEYYTLLPEISSVWSYDGAKVREDIESILDVTVVDHTYFGDTVGVNVEDTFIYEFRPTEGNQFPKVEVARDLGGSYVLDIRADYQYVETNTFDSNAISSTFGRGFYSATYDPYLRYEYTFEPVRDANATYIDVINIMQTTPLEGSPAVQGSSNKQFLDGLVLTDLGSSDDTIYYENVSYPMLQINGSGKPYGDASMEERYNIDNIDFDWYVNAMYYGTDEGAELGLEFEEVFYEQGTYMNYVNIMLPISEGNQYYLSPNCKLMVNGIEVAATVTTDVQAGREIYAQYYFNVGEINEYSSAKLLGINEPVAGEIPTSADDVECVDSGNRPLPLYVSRLAWFVDANNNNVMDSGEEATVILKSDGTYDSASLLSEDGTFKTNTKYKVQATLALDDDADGMFADIFATTLDMNGVGMNMTNGTNEAGVPTATYLFATTESGVLTSASATITAPVAGANPDMSPVSGDSSKYTVTIDPEYVWCLLEGTYPKLTSTDVFEAGKQYVARVIFTPKSGYSFADSATFTINGQRADSYHFTNIGARQVQFSVPEAATDGISGTVESFGSDENESTYILLYSGQGSAISPEPAYEAVVTGTGIKQYNIGNVPAGKYTMIVSKKNHTTAKYLITVSEGSVTQNAKLLLLGDLNNNGILDAEDHILMKDYIFDTSVLTDAQRAVADIDGDKKICATDYMLIKRMYIGQ